MTLWAVVPVKPLGYGKSRLSPVLGREQRRELNRYLLCRTVTVLKGLSQIGVVLVVSRDPEALALARSLGARTLLESRSEGLNQAVLLGTLLAQRSRADAALILPTDLPLLSRAALETFLSAAQSAQPLVAIAPDRHRRGTNALYLVPPNLPRFCFGENSFQAHCELAMQLCRRCAVIDVPELAFDLDDAEDWELAGTLLSPDSPLPGYF
ncbi:MAG: 2-phospho-L-lactate guanylyltransferase [Anaerolineales bacterium]|nr:2-phospho-L-lactate guanylyltransferase [Anaerolineales bacterium]MCS7248344.1 2-phospho-L-lactate guanylyltransferase [Anaerolineales bacterium]MDW8162157.1 2-phospho-L-lactate guanylyltransferase [Anaerolineales bacterium]MDW8446712.1 2-phospho-L-lactate guanylyltransferase [Anaerolineales bacterium]